jgi:8-oxo-dGTP pyrophosphatase MutT (NUDIX family)
MQIKRFNVRVYGLLFNAHGEVLLSDECRNGYSFTKFPGGGVEHGEGIADALVREFCEELGISVSVGDLFYVNDFFQASAFQPNDQLIAFYYRVYSDELSQIVCHQQEVPITQEGEQHRWIDPKDLQDNVLNFPIDRHVACLLRQG